MIDWIDDNVAIGNWMDARNVKMLQREGIDLVLDSRVLFDDSKGRSRRTPKVDLIEREVRFILALAGMGAKVLIRCYHGRDRSPFVAMVYISRKLGISHLQAYEMVKERRRMTVPHWDWVDMLEKNGEGVSTDDVLSGSD
ncbi:MAG: dual specificity protein phosphatase family protein [Methanomassiliicoccales archaeon]|nr:MAG: dual specificity protein phosphatase family protein [Methanomassiliicoccales archaeon]